MKKYMIWSGIAIVLAVAMGLYLYATRPVKVGFVGELSTSSSELSVESREAFLYVVDMFNQKGGVNGRKIVPVIYDDKNDNSNKIKLNSDLNRDGVKLVVGFNVSSMVPTINYLMANGDYLIVSPTVTTDEMTGKDDRFIKISPPNAKQVTALLPAIEKEQVDKMLIIYNGNNLQYTQTLVDKMTEAFESKNKTIVDTIKVTKGIDYDRILKNLTQAQPDGIFMVMNGYDTAQIVQYARINGYKGSFFAGTWATTSDLLENVGAYGNGLYTCEVAMVSPDKDNYNALQTAIKARSGSDLNFSHTRAYNATKLLIEAMIQTGSTDPEVVKRAILEKKDFQGVETQFSIDANGDTTGNYRLLQVKDGKFVEVK